MALKTHFKWILISSCLVIFLFLTVILHLDEINYTTKEMSYGPGCGCRESGMPGANSPEAISTCSYFAQKRGYNQRVVSFTFFQGHSFDIYHRDYLSGVQGNLERVKQLYDGFVMRLYVQIPKNSDTWSVLCKMVCREPMLDICDVDDLPVFANKTSIMYPLMWRFLPSLDPQVDVMLVRDLDSLISAREVAAVNEFLNSTQDFHVMRDHPQHGVPILGGTWAAKLLRFEVRKKFADAMIRIFESPYFSAPRHERNHDQDSLNKFIWPWARRISMAHDSYFCRKYIRTRPFPTKREPGANNYVGSVAMLNDTIRPDAQCPLLCRPEKHPDWIYC